MKEKSQGHLIRQKLVNISNRLGVRYSNIETMFLLERLVARLVANRALNESLVFKGGYVGLRVYESPRYTVDLDALLIKFDLVTALNLAKKCAETNLRDGVWFQFEAQKDIAAQGEYGGIRQVYRAGIGEVLKNFKKAQIVNFDLGIGDPIIPGPKMVATPALIEQDKDISWSVYPIETIIAEKIHALISFGDFNSRSKDIYDLSIFLEKTDITKLKESLVQCFRYRQTELPKKISSKLNKLDTTWLEKGWTNSVASLSNPPKFKEAFGKIVKFLSKNEDSLHQN